MRKLKISELLLFAMAALHCGVSEDIEVIKGNCNDDISLPCKATNRTKTYRYIMWYKTEKLPIIKRKNNNYTHYNFTSISLRDKETLVLHKVQPSDSGKYRCYLAAEVGGQNDESFIELNISECVSTVYPITTIPATADPCPAVEELTVPWAVIGLSLISVAKIILCIVTVEVEQGTDALAGLVLKDLLKNITTLYKFANHSYEVGEDNSLLVPASAELDCGIYRCTLWPPLGHYIQEANTKYDSAALTLNTVAGNDELLVTASCRDDITLDCTFRQNCQSYTSVTWYKLYNNSSDRSTMRILIKSENVIQTDKHNDSMSLDKNASLVLRKVSPANSGIYKCLIRAKAGGKNCQNRVRLNISDDSVLFVLWSCVGLAVSIKVVLCAVCIWCNDNNETALIL
ncbi:CD83 antigen-like protein [Labeo rohita]|uniref:CD83 antigen-like protein n=1 Tax=Labeo rohita TaxID=84645 RepID=A0A498MBX2_LABRO|nr:CD83 antigen-like protein [Labeo rohita]